MTRWAAPVLSRLMKTLLCWNLPKWPWRTFFAPAAEAIIFAARTSTGEAPDFPALEWSGASSRMARSRFSRPSLQIASMTSGSSRSYAKTSTRASRSSWQSWMKSKRALRASAPSHSYCAWNGAAHEFKRELRGPVRLPIMGAWGRA